jgi:hypothetical protein
MEARRSAESLRVLRALGLGILLGWFVLRAAGLAESGRGGRSG